MTMSPRMRNIGNMMGIISLPMVIFFIFFLSNGQNGQYHDEEMLVHEHAINLSKDIGSALASQFSMLDHIGFIYNEVVQDDHLRNQLIQHFFASHDDVADMAIVDNRGKEVLHKRAIPTNDGIQLVDRSQNIEFLTLKDKGYYLGPVYLSQGKPVFLMGHAIFSTDGKSMRGAIFALLKADVIVNKLKQAATQEGTIAFIVNNKGIVIAHPSFLSIDTAKDVSHNPVVELAIGNNAAPVRIYKNELTEQVVGSGFPLMISLDSHAEIFTNWFVIVETPAVVAFAGAVAGRNTALLIFLILIGCAGAAAVAIDMNMGVAMGALNRALQELNAGNFDYRLHLSNQIQWKQISTGINSLAERLKRISNDLAEEKHTVSVERRKLNLALSEISDAVIARDTQGFSILTNKSAEDMVGYASDTVAGKHVDEVVYSADSVAMTAHELRTPLTEVKWAMSLLMGKELGILSRKQKNILKRSSDSNEYMIRLVDDLLKTAAIETGQLRYDKIPADMKTILDNLVEMQRSIAMRKGILIKFKKSKGRMPLISVDAAAIKIAINNILENAINYTPKGGTITVSLGKTDSSMEVSVVDTGIGMLPEDREQVFVKFFRGKNAIKIVADGTGLGLYVTKKIIEDHGGNVRVESEIGKGSICSIQIPI